MVLETRRLLDRASRWLLSNRPQPLAVGAEINRFHKVVSELAPDVPALLRGAEREAVAEDAEELVAANVPAELARRVASLLDCYALLDITEVAELADRDGLDTERSPRETAELYYTLSEHLNIDSMLTSISGLERGNRWHALARLALRDDLYSSLRAITLDVLRQSDPGTSADEKIENWERNNYRRISRSRESLEEIRRVGSLDLATLSVATRQVRSMVR
jgi:glutamate dehydrogenase